MTNSMIFDGSRALWVAFLAAGSLLVASQARADLLNLSPGSNTINGVNISTGAKSADQVDLTTIASGLRRKRVAIIDVNVYVLQVLVNDSSQWQRYNAARDGSNPLASMTSLNSLQGETSIGLTLSFLRTVDGPTVATSFREALTTNGLDTDSGDLAQFLALVSSAGDAKNGSTIELLLTRDANGSETIRYQGSNGQVQSMTASNPVIQSILSIWLGKTGEMGLNNLKKQLIGG